MKRLFRYFKTHPHRLATAALLFGFVVDIISFRTINLALAQIILSVHLSIVGLSIILLALPQPSSMSGLAARLLGFIPVLQQYSLGNLLSAFLVLYSGSGSFTQSWIFYAMLAIAAIGNETLKLQKYRLPFTTTLFFLNLLLFFALALPVATGSISVTSFLLSLVAGTVVFQIFRWVLWLSARQTFRDHRRYINRGTLSVLVVLSLLYFTNLIPPIPLSLKHIGFYHNVVRQGDAYILERESRNIIERFFDIGGASISAAPGQGVFVFTAVFAPAAVDTNAIHRWEYFDADRKTWVTRNVVRFPLTGGRDGGYRAYSLVENPAEGRWRVSVETTRGAVIGRAHLTVRHVDTPRETVEEIRE